eukprot:10342985-Prorocentrum_lima.AAC.1
MGRSQFARVQVLEGKNKPSGRLWGSLQDSSPHLYPITCGIFQEKKNVLSCERKGCANSPVTRIGACAAIDASTMVLL